MSVIIYSVLPGDKRNQYFPIVIILWDIARQANNRGYSAAGALAEQKPGDIRPAEHAADKNPAVFAP
jgi:hypothetical protein